MSRYNWTLACTIRKEAAGGCWKLIRLCCCSIRYPCLGKKHKWKKVLTFQRYPRIGHLQWRSQSFCVFQRRLRQKRIPGTPQSPLYKQISTFSLTRCSCYSLATALERQLRRQREQESPSLLWPRLLLPKTKDCLFTWLCNQARGDPNWRHSMCFGLPSFCIAKSCRNERCNHPNQSNNALLQSASLWRWHHISGCCDPAH